MPSQYHPNTTPMIQATVKEANILLTEAFNEFHQHINRVAEQTGTTKPDTASVCNHIFQMLPGGVIATPSDNGIKVEIITTATFGTHRFGPRQPFDAETLNAKVIREAIANMRSTANGITAKMTKI